MFVTNNGIDFRPPYRSPDLHPDLVVILPGVRRAKQVAFVTVLRHVQAEADTVDMLIEIDVEGVITMAPLPLPRGNS